MKKNIVIAFGSVPKDSGTFTFYRTLRPRLLEYGFDFRCVCVGRAEADLVDEAFIDDGCVFLARKEINIKRQAEAFAGWCEQTGVDIVLASNSIALLSALPHLPERIRVMSRCANSFDHGYRITISSYKRLAAIVATTPRMIRDLVNKYAVEKDKIRLIPNGVQLDVFRRKTLALREKAKPLRLGFLGRLEHKQKGVLYLPEIINRIDQKGIDFTFQIGGKGVHGKALKKELQPFVRTGQVVFRGHVPPQEVPRFLHDSDVFVFPSRFEGCPNMLLEAIASGCVPVAWKLEGITDFIIRDSLTGFVCDFENFDQFSSKIEQLASDLTKLLEMSEMAFKDAEARFSADRLTSDYCQLFKEIMAEPTVSWTSLPWSDFKIDENFDQNNWHMLVPRPLKVMLKRFFFALGMSNRYE